MRVARQVHIPADAESRMFPGSVFRWNGQARFPRAVVFSSTGSVSGVLSQEIHFHSVNRPGSFRAVPEGTDTLFTPGRVSIAGRLVCTLYGRRDT